MSRNVKLAVGAAVLVIILGGLTGYFFAAPALQIGGYKKEVQPAQEKLHASFEELHGDLGDARLQNADVKVTDIVAVTKDGQDALKDARANLDANRKRLTDFPAWPLLDFNGSYKAAVKVKSLEADYIKTLDEYFTETETSLTYMEKLTPVMQKVENLTADMEKTLSAEEDPTEKLKNFSQQMQTLSAEFDALKAPESLASYQSTNAKMFKDMAAIFKDLADASAAQDLDKLLEAYSKLGELAAEAQKASGTQFASFIKDSKIIRLADKIKGLNRDITAELSKM